MKKSSLIVLALSWLAVISAQQLPIEYNASCPAIWFARSQCYLELTCSNLDKQLPTEFHVASTVPIFCCYPSSGTFMRLSIESDLSSPLTFNLNQSSLRQLEVNQCHGRQKFIQFSSIEMRISQVRGVRFDSQVFALDQMPMNYFVKLSHIFLSDPYSNEINCSLNYSTNIFNSTSARLSLTFQNGNRYALDMCDLLFSNANIYSLAFLDVIDSLVKQNRVTWKQIRSADQLNSRVDLLLIEGYNMRLDEKLFAKSIFRRTSSLDLSGQLSSFAPASLAAMNVSQIGLYTAGLRKFLHSNLNWLDGVGTRNSTSALTIYLDGIVAIDKLVNSRPLKGYLERTRDPIYWICFKKRETFTDQDFCLFRSMTSKALDTGLILRGYQLELNAHEKCTCTLAWIAANHFTNLTKRDKYTYSDLLACAAKLNECNFTQLELSCSLTTLSIDYTSLYERMITAKYWNFICTVALLPCTALVGFVANAISRHMWDYVYMNSVFMLLQSLIFAFAPLTACIEYNGIYCSPLILTRFSQAFYLFVESYAGNALRLMAHMSNLMFVLYRYAVNRNCWSQLRSLKPRTFLAAIIVFSLVVSLSKISANERFDYQILTEEASLYLSVTLSPSLLSPTLSRILFLSNIILTSILFPLLTLVFDICLLKYMRAQSKENRKEIVESRLTKMVILNSLFSLLFRLPDMAVSVYVTVASQMSNVRTDDNNNCVILLDPMDSLCHILPQYSKLLYSFSLSENLLLLYLFNPVFKRAMEQLLF
nr:G protein-coupled receptor [Proales similis]